MTDFQRLCATLRWLLVLRLLKLAARIVPRRDPEHNAVLTHLGHLRIGVRATLKRS